VEQNLCDTPGQTGSSNQGGEVTEQAKEQGQQHAQQAGQLANRGSEPTITDTVERLGRVTEMVDVLAERRRSRHASPGSMFWVVFADECRLTCPLTLSLEGGKEALAVFSHQEEADMLLRWFGTVGEGWRIRQTSAGEVVSLLYGPCCGANTVALDPLPEMLADSFISSVALQRGRFFRWVTSRKLSPPRCCRTPVERVTFPIGPEGFFIEGLASPKQSRTEGNGGARLSAVGVLIDKGELDGRASIHRFEKRGEKEGA
jgi:hypothetical protein